MTTAIQKVTPAALEQQQRDSMEVRIALNANLWGMPDDQVWAYYRWMSERLALDPMSHPFDIITDAKQQKKALYANSSCTSQLGDRAKLSYGKLEIDVNDGLLALGFKVAHISVAVTSPDGRTLVAEAFVDLMSGWEGKPLAGNNLINALKKGGTQCRRRGTLQMLGLAAAGEATPTVRLGDIERTDEDAEGVIIEQPPASALQAAPEKKEHRQLEKVTEGRLMEMTIEHEFLEEMTGRFDYDEPAPPANLKKVATPTSGSLAAGQVIHEQDEFLEEPSPPVKPLRGSKLLDMQAALEWTDAQLLQVIFEETKIDKKLSLSQVLEVMTDTQGRRMVQVLKAELETRRGRE